MEPLEDPRLFSTLTVTNLQDSGLEALEGRWLLSSGKCRSYRGPYVDWTRDQMLGSLTSLYIWRSSDAFELLSPLPLPPRAAATGHQLWLSFEISLLDRTHSPGSASPREPLRRQPSRPNHR